MDGKTALKMVNWLDELVELDRCPDSPVGTRQRRKLLDRKNPERQLTGSDFMNANMPLEPQNCSACWRGRTRRADRSPGAVAEFPHIADRL